MTLVHPAYRGVRMGKRNRPLSESSSTAAAPKPKKPKTLADALGDNLANGHGAEHEDEEVWLVRKPISVTCEDLEEANFRFPTTSSKPSTSAKLPSERRVNCLWDKPRCSLIRVSLTGKKSQLRAISEVAGTLSLTMKPRDVDQTTDEDGGVIEFPTVRKLPQVPPTNVKLIQRLEAFGVKQDASKTKKKKKQKKTADS